MSDPNTSTPAAAEPTASNVTVDNADRFPPIMTLNVGGRTFVTSRETLREESGLFKLNMSNDFAAWTPQADGSYFLDADPYVFDHLLRFMRRPAVFPVFFSTTHGFDYHLYNLLEAESEYFQMWTLNKWIKDKSFNHAVQVEIECSPPTELKERYHATLDANKSYDMYPVPYTRTFYTCRCGIKWYKANPQRCSKVSCFRRGGDYGIEWEEEAYAETTHKRTTLNLNERVCRSWNQT